MKTEKASPATPWHLWLIGGLLFVFNSFAAVDYIATITRFEPYLANYPQETLDYFFNAPAWMYLMWGGSMLGGFVSALFLLLRRKIAIPLAVLAWVCSAVVAVHDYINPAPVSPGVLFYAGFLLVALLLIYYMHRLSRRGVLR